MKTFVIHLEELIDRKKNMIWQLEENGMDAEFISNYGRDVLTIEDKKPYTGNLTDSEISLFLHHIECWKKTTDSVSLILEDDAVFDCKFNENLEKYIEEMESIDQGWDMLYLGDGCRLHINSQMLQDHPSTRIFRNDSTRCTDSIVISNACCKKLLDEVNSENFETEFPVDFWLNDAIRKLSLRVYWAEPTIVTQGSQCFMFNSSLR